MDENKYGLLLNQDIKIQRQHFREMTKLLGIYVIYRYPISESKYTSYAEIESNYSQPILTGCIFDEHPTQQTLKKMGWVSELQTNSSFIHVDYDLPNIQQGSLFIIPSGIDNTKGRLFRVISMSVGVVYPASITCEIIPEYVDTFKDESYNFEESSMNLVEQEDEPGFVEWK